MKRLKELKEQRAEKLKRLDALATKAEKETLTAEEKTEFKALETEMDSFDDEISLLERVEKRSKDAAKAAIDAGDGARALPGAPQDDEAMVKEMNKMSKAFKVANAVGQILKTKSTTGVAGLEREMFEEAEREAKQAGVSLQGNIAIPSKFIQIGERKLLDVATEGTDAVYTEFGGLIPILRPNPVVSQLGAQILTGLQGNVQWTRQNGDISFAFETENSDVNETTPTLDNISISPKRFGGYIDVSKQFLIQAPWVVERWLRAQMEARYALTLDTQALVGDGTSNAPTGVLNYPGVNVVSTGSGSANDMTWGLILEFIRSTKTAFAQDVNPAWLTNANGEFALARTPMQASGVEGNFIYKMDGKLVGRPFLTSELIPSTYSEGGQSDLVGMIYGARWKSLIIGTWGGLDILFDPYTQALGGKNRLVLNAYMDVEVEHPLEFAVTKDWDATDLPGIC